MSFRLRGAVLGRLNERAEEARQSRGDCARQLLTEALQGERHDELRASVEGLRGDVARIRVDLAKTLEVILLNVAKGVTEREARAFVSKHLRE